MPQKLVYSLHGVAVLLFLNVFMIIILVIPFELSDRKGEEEKTRVFSRVLLFLCRLRVLLWD